MGFKQTSLTGKMGLTQHGAGYLVFSVAGVALPSRTVRSVTEEKAALII